MCSSRMLCSYLAHDLFCTTRDTAHGLFCTTRDAAQGTRGIGHVGCGRRLLPILRVLSCFHRSVASLALQPVSPRFLSFPRDLRPG